MEDYTVHTRQRIMHWDHNSLLPMVAPSPVPRLPLHNGSLGMRLGQLHPPAVGPCAVQHKLWSSCLPYYSGTSLILTPFGPQKWNKVTSFWGWIIWIWDSSRLTKVALIQVSFKRGSTAQQWLLSFVETLQWCIRPLSSVAWKVQGSVPSI